MAKTPFRGILVRLMLIDNEDGLSLNVGRKPSYQRKPERWVV
jgi:hypothetical protein